MIKEYESKLTILTTRVNELTSINNNLSQAKGKLEKELSGISRYASSCRISVRAQEFVMGDVRLEVEEK